MISRRSFLAATAAGAAAALARRSAFAMDAAGTPAGAPPALVVYKSASCGCCKQWVERMRAAGFAVTTHDTDDVAAVKKQFAVPAALHSCHTALVGGYVVEGHVPPDLVQRLLKERPRVVGLATPGMPAGSPGMEMGPRKDRYDVMAWDRAGATRVYASR